MEEKVGRRSKEDEQWQETRRQCKLRDRNMCVICKMLTPGEHMLFMKSHPAFLQTIDIAHIESVSGHIEKVYDVNNVVCLCRCHHSRLDAYQNPITGKRMSAEEHEEWWKRIKDYAGIEDTVEEKDE